MFTAFRCYSGECITEDGLPVALLLSNQPLVFIGCVGIHLVSLIFGCSLIVVWAEIKTSFALLLLLFWSQRHGLLFVFLYVAGYMLVTMGIPAGTRDWPMDQSADWEVGRFLASCLFAALQLQCHLVQEEARIHGKDPTGIKECRS